MASPLWMSKELFQTALNKYFSSEVVIVDIKSTNAVPVGDNYTSDTYRVTVSFQMKNSNVVEIISLILKSSSEDDGAKADLAVKLKLFERESATFEHTLPKLTKVLGSSLWANYVYSNTGTRRMIILEDLGPSGYTMFDRKLGYDLEHCIVSLKKLAKFHAASIVVLQNEPRIIDDYAEGLYSKNPLITEWVNMGFKSLIKSSATWPGCQIYSKKLQNLGEKLIERSLETLRRSDFNVLNHGDLWINNMLFRYNQNGRATDLKFVDFQLCVYASPAVDLHYFMATSPSINVRTAHLDFILEYYFAQLVKNLVKCEHNLENVPDRNAFREDFNKRSFYGLLTAATVLPLVKSSSRSDASFEDLMKDDGDDGFRHHCYNNDRYRMYMEHLFPYYDNLGVLD